MTKRHRERVWPPAGVRGAAGEEGARRELRSLESRGRSGEEPGLGPGEGHNLGGLSTEYSPDKRKEVEKDKGSRS